MSRRHRTDTRAPGRRGGPEDNYGFEREPRIADLMTTDHDRFVESSRAAERAGDARTALEFHVGVPMFARGAHAVLLRQLAGLSTDEMPPWLWARWAAYQCTRAEEPTHEVWLRVRSAMQYVVDHFYGERLAEAFETGRDYMPVVANVIGRSWLYRQVCTYELGGLSGFLDHLAAGDLRDHSGLARSWVAARMGGYRLDQDADGLVAEDLATGEPQELLDIGAGVGPGVAGTIVPATDPTPRWVIGRVVPSGTDPGWMFDTRPIAVDERTAREVAASTGTGWMDVVRAAIRAGRLDLRDFEPEDHELVTDVEGLALVRIGTSRAALQATLDKLARGSDEIGRSAFKILEQVARRRTGPEVTPPVVAAAVLQPHAWDEARRALVGPAEAEEWRAWADQVTEPARGRLDRLSRAATTLPEAG